MSAVVPTRRGKRPVGPKACSVVLVAVTWWVMGTALAATPLEEKEQLEEVCEFGAPVIEDEDLEAHRDYHNQRRHLVHEVYETSLPALGEELMGYDRVAGLLTISGFRTYRPHPGAPAIRFRNECILSFEVDEEEAHDIMAKLQMGTVEVRIGYQLAAHRDYDVDYCPRYDGGDQRAMEVDLLYARLVDRERGGSKEEQIIGTYHTPMGHRAALQRSMKIVDSVAGAVPEVEISHFQWRPRGGSWKDEFEESDATSSLHRLERRLVAGLERELYPCYIGALSQNAALQGAVVVGVPFGAEASGSPTFLMDTLQQSTLRECIDERVEALVEATESDELEEVDAFKATVLMRRR